MNHQFVASGIDNTKCAYMMFGKQCGLDIISHTRLAKCESCGIQEDCNLNEERMLLCANCWQAHESARVARKNESNLDNQTAAQIANTLIANAAIRHTPIANYGDFFNAETVSHSDLRKQIEADESIPESDKEKALLKLLTERREILMRSVWNLNDELFQKNQQLSAVDNSIRTFAAEVRAEAIAELKRQDEQYKPQIAQKPKVEPKLKAKAEKKSPMETMIQILMGSTGKTYQECKQMIESGKME